MKLVFATHNANKLKEVQAMLPDDIQLVSLYEVGCEQEIPETAQTIEDNAKMKAQYVVQHFGFECFADDTGLEVEALGGAPGVHSARYAGAHKNNQDNIVLLLENLKGKSNRKAQFKTVFALSLQGEIHLFKGIVKGSITLEPQGNNGFGYDSVFMPDGYAETFAQMSAEQKNQISHRAIAVQKLVQFLKNHTKK